MFKKVWQAVGDWLGDSGTSAPPPNSESWLGWFSFEFEPRTKAEEKEKECYLYLDGRLVKIKLEAYKKGLESRLRGTVLELDGRLILPEEQNRTAEEITRNYGQLLSESNQRILLVKLLANFGVRVGENIRVIRNDSAESYARFLRLQSRVNQSKKREEGGYVHH